MARAIFLVAFSLLAILLQVAAIMALRGAVSGLDPMLAFLTLQVLASLSLVLVAGPVIMRHYHRTTGWLYLYVFVGCLFMPVVGMLVFFLLWLMIALLGYSFVPLASANRIEPPGFVARLVRGMVYGGGTRIRARLENPDSSDSDRMAAMTALQSMPIHLTEEVLRNLLSDQKEELRLLAYGLMDSAEKGIMEEIARTQQKLEKNGLAGKEEGYLHARMAQLYWELIYQRLVAGDVYQYVLDRVMEHARFAVSIDEEEGQMWYLLARCSLLRKQPEQAAHYLGHAARHDFPRERLLPWQAEAAFLQRNFTDVRRHLASVDYSLAAAQLQPGIRFWTT